jgi:uncharacterized cupredoxin-like copper-binding protein
MKVRGWLALTALIFVLAGCSRADPSIIAMLPEEGNGAAPGEPGDVVIDVAADPAGQLRFVQDTLNGPADQDFTVNFDNPAAVEHNWVMVEPGQEEAVVQAAQAQGGDIDGVNGIIAGHNPITSASESIPVPATEAGTYTYVCTVPGHFAAGMRGEITLGALAEGEQPAGGEQNGGAAAGGATSASVSADPSGQLRFAEETMSVAAGQPVTVTFSNPAPVEHNWVLVEPGQEDAVASAALGTGGDAIGLDGVIGASDVIVNGASDTVDLEALDAGEYTYICTVPGHYQAGMRGTLTAGP